MKHISKNSYETKEALYTDLNRQLSEILADETHWIPNLSNASALFWHILEEINWSGSFIAKQNKLFLGPFQGLPACTGIEFGSGVCGTAASSREIQVVPNVNEFPGHIACDGETKSEIVVPLVWNDEVVGVLDIDSPIFSRFDAEDAKGLEVFAQIILNSINWDEV